MATKKAGLGKGLDSLITNKVAPTKSTEATTVKDEKEVVLVNFWDGSSDEEGLLDNTVIVLYGDHDAKLPKSDYARLYNYDKEIDDVLDKNDENYKPVDYYDYELNRSVPLIIWTKDKKYNMNIELSDNVWYMLACMDKKAEFDMFQYMRQKVKDENIIAQMIKNYYVLKRQ